MCLRGEWPRGNKTGATLGADEREREGLGWSGGVDSPP